MNIDLKNLQIPYSDLSWNTSPNSSSLELSQDLVKLLAFVIEFILCFSSYLLMKGGKAEPANQWISSSFTLLNAKPHSVGYKIKDLLKSAAV